MAEMLMRTEQRQWTHFRSWEPESSASMSESAQLVMLFGATSVLKARYLIDQVKTAYPNAHIFGCSTAGEIIGDRVSDDTLVSTAIHFEHTRVSGGRIRLTQTENSFHAGKMLAQLLDPENLTHVMVLSDGLAVNGSELVRGLVQYLPEHVTVTGGLAGDGDRFGETLTFWDSMPEKDTVAILGLHGNRLKVGYGSMGGWDPFGPERLVTRSDGNVLYELDGNSALALYKKYLGEYADELPATGLYFPLSVRTASDETGVVRAFLSIDEENQSLKFAGDIPVGAYARLMKANIDRLIDGAVGAAETCYRDVGSIFPDMAVLISCVARKLVLRQRVEEEVEGVHNILGDCTTLTGFYSYGEISPLTRGGKCELHNQTMTITTFSET